MRPKSPMLQLVVYGIGIALALAWVQSLSPKGLNFIPYRESVPEIEFHFSCRAAETTKEVQAFVDTVKNVTNGVV